MDRSVGIVFVSESRRLRTAESLQWDHRVVVMILGVGNDLFLLALAHDHTGVTPIGIVHVPERIDRESEREDGEAVSTRSQDSG
jgi:hypothetical protein